MHSEVGKTATKPAYFLKRKKKNNPLTIYSKMDTIGSIPIPTATTLVSLNEVDFYGLMLQWIANQFPKLRIWVRLPVRLQTNK